MLFLCPQFPKEGDAYEHYGNTYFNLSNIYSLVIHR